MQQHQRSRLRSRVRFCAPLLIGLFVLLASVSSAAASYNRTAAVNYADAWTHGRNSAYRNYDPNDCTNFASQILAAGGVPQIYGDGYVQHDQNWFNVSLGNSYSWSAANNMKDHFNLTPSRYATRSSVGSLFAGDIIFMKFSGDSVPNHTRIVVGTGYSSSDGTSYPAGTLGTLIDQHSNDKKHVLWNDGAPFGTAYYYYDVVY